MNKNNQHQTCAKCQKELNYLPYHSYAEPPALKSKEGEFYCFDCFKGVSHCKVCGKSAAQIDINIHDKKTWYQPWEKIYFREAEHIKPFDMCGRYCDFFCSPECLAQDDSRNHEVKMKKNQAELAQGWKYCEECVETYEEIFAKKDKRFRERAIKNHAYLVPPSEKICKFHKRWQAKGLYIDQVIRPKAQKWWDLLSYEEKLSEVKKHDIHWIAAEKRKGTHEEVASRPKVPPFIISQDFQYKEPCISCGKIWKCVSEINCGKNSPAGKISYCASCPSSAENNQNGIENESKDGDSSLLTEIETKKTQLQKIKEERGENSEEVKKLQQEITKLLSEQNPNNLSSDKQSQKDLTPLIIGSLLVVALVAFAILLLKSKHKNPKIK